MGPVKIRSGLDRLRYALMFEAILVVLLGAALWMLSDQSLADSGIVAAVLSLIAVIVALGYNYVLDRIDAHYGRVPTERSTLGRVGHALGLELTLVLASLPVIMQWLGWGFWKALTFDLSAVAFVVVYTYIFTLVYDKVFPVPQ